MDLEARNIILSATISCSHKIFFQIALRNQLKLDDVFACDFALSLLYFWSKQMLGSPSLSFRVKEMQSDRQSVSFPPPHCALLAHLQCAYVSINAHFRFKFWSKVQFVHGFPPLFRCLKLTTSQWKRR